VHGSAIFLHLSVRPNYERTSSEVFFLFANGSNTTRSTADEISQSPPMPTVSGKSFEQTEQSPHPNCKPETAWTRPKRGSIRSDGVKQGALRNVCHSETEYNIQKNTKNKTGFATLHRQKRNSTMPMPQQVDSGLTNAAHHSLGQYISPIAAPR
jgi:hypothetical protein